MSNIVHRAHIWRINPPGIRYGAPLNPMCNSWYVEAMCHNWQCMGHIRAIEENNPWNERECEHALFYWKVWLREREHRFYRTHPLGRKHTP